MTNPTSKDLLDELRWQLAKIEDKQAENKELLGRLDTVKAELSALSVSATSPDGTVTVVAGSGGIVRSVDLADSALRSNSKTLSAAITETVRAAIAQATRKQWEIVRGEIGDGVEPEQVLGPQARFTAFAGQSPARARVEVDDDEPMDSILFRRDRD